MRSIIFYATTLSLSITAALLAKPMPMREVPGQAQCASHPSNKKNQKKVQRIVPGSTNSTPVVQPKQIAVAPITAQISHQQPVQRIIPGTAHTTASTTVWHSPKQVAIAPTPAAAVYTPVYEIAPQAAITQVCPVMVYEPAPVSVAVACKPAVRPYMALTPSIITTNLKYMTLSDGSQWRIRHRDRPLIRHWHSGDLIGIELGGYFSRFQYKLVNHTRRETVEVNRS